MSAEDERTRGRGLNGPAPEAPRAGSTVSELLRRCWFPAPGTEVDCAISGGPDSLALLVLAVEADLQVTAHHVDHGLRPGSAAEAELVHAAAERFGAAFRSHSVVVEPGPNLEARARKARYDVLPAGVLTGHTMDDQAETVLLNLMRGAGLDGLAGMTPYRRPLRALRRSDTVALCAELELTPLHDSSNDDPRFRRNRVRHELIPLLDDIADRDVVPILVRQSNLLRDDAELLGEHADRALANLETNVALAAELPPAIVRRAIRKWLRNHGYGRDELHPPDAKAVERILAVVRSEAVGCDIGQGWRVTRRNNRLRLHSPDS